MKNAQVIDFYAYSPVRKELDLADFRRRAEGRYRASLCRKAIVAATETVVTALIGAGFVLCLALVFTML